MILFTILLAILLVVLLISLIVIVLTVGIGGIAFMLVFGDIIVCIFIVWLLTKLFSKKKKKDKKSK